MANKKFSFSLLFCFMQFYLTLAEDKPCGRHNVKMDYFRNCAEPKSQNIKIYNVTCTITDDCKVIPRGCFKVKKAISAAKVDYVVTKSPFKKKGTEDLCKALESPDAQKGLEGYKTLPQKCTISPGDYCITKGSTVVEQLNPNTLNILQGTATGVFNIESEGSKDKACVEFKITVTKK